MVTGARVPKNLACWSSLARVCAVGSVGFKPVSRLPVNGVSTAKRSDEPASVFRMPGHISHVLDAPRISSPKADMRVTKPDTVRVLGCGVGRDVGGVGVGVGV